MKQDEKVKILKSIIVNCQMRLRFLSDEAYIAFSKLTPQQVKSRKDELEARIESTRRLLQKIKPP